MKLTEKSLIILELPEVLELLSAEAVSDGAKDAALKLRPFIDSERVKAELGETTAATYMMVHRQSPPFSGVKDIRGIVRRAQMSGMLNPRELLDVADLLRAAASSVSYFTADKNSEETSIDYLFNALMPNRFLHTKIQTAILSEEEVSDNASPGLADIRRHIRLAEDKIRQTLNKIITSSSYAKILQEPIITIRNNRYVVPVKAEQKANMPGMVHDISSSGATHFIEPMAVVNLNNELRELGSKESEEIDRILMELSSDVAGYADSIISDYEILVKLDFIFAKAKLSYNMEAIEPEISNEKHITLQRVRHPLLPKNEAVPIDISLGGDIDTLIITGPNTGGKTVALKSIGLMCAMAACGLHIPAHYGSTVPVFDEILADIGDEQSIEQSLSTFSSHMVNIVNILDECTSNSLLLFDELGAGTDPVEGAALAISIIEHTRKRGMLIAATTHYAELKEYALKSKGVINASCEFDLETLKPTYRLIVGIPGRSNAFAISKQLGLPDNIIENAKSHISTEDTAFEEVIQGLEQTRTALEKERTETARLMQEAQAAHSKMDELRRELDRERDKLVEKAKKEAADIIKEARDTARNVVDEIRQLQRSITEEPSKQGGNDEKVNLLRRLNEAEAALETPSHKKKKKEHPREIVPGDRVLIDDINTQADVIEVSGDGALSLQAGIMKVTSHIDEVTLVDSKDKTDVKKHIAKQTAKLRTGSVKPELDLRGMTGDEALPVMVQFIDNAKMAKLSSVTIIHGKGTGALRKAVHKELKSGGHGIKSYRLGVFGEGEDGVTIVEL